jgi:hypothetical protein
MYGPRCASQRPGDIPVRDFKAWSYRFHLTLPSLTTLRIICVTVGALVRHVPIVGGGCSALTGVARTATNGAEREWKEPGVAGSLLAAFEGKASTFERIVLL